MVDIHGSVPYWKDFAPDSKWMRRGSSTSLYTYQFIEDSQIKDNDIFTKFKILFETSSNSIHLNNNTNNNSSSNSNSNSTLNLNNPNPNPTTLINDVSRIKNAFAVSNMVLMDAFEAKIESLEKQSVIGKKLLQVSDW